MKDTGILIRGTAMTAMRFTVGNTAYRIIFHHGHHNVAIRGIGPTDQDFTTAIIKEWPATPPPDGDNKVVGEATVHRHFKDKPNKDSARKEALKAALAISPRPFRAEAWKAYHNRNAMA